MSLRYDGLVVVVTGAGAGLGRAYAEFFASRGAKVVVNDLGSSLQGKGISVKAADAVVGQIITNGGIAVANYDSVENGKSIIDTAISNFGRIDILINNAGILRDVSFKNMNDDDWDSVQAVHMRGVYKTTQAAWSYFRQQKFGRIILTSSAAGLYGNFGQCNYSAAKSGMVGLGETLAKEGVKYNILTNIIAPVAAIRMTATVMPPDLLHQLTPDWVVPIVAVLVHPDTNFENGSVIEAGAGHVSKIRWERSAGALLRSDETLTPGAVLAKWTDVNDFSNAEYPNTTADLVGLLKRSQSLPPNDPGETIRFDGRVAVVTGGGAGLGRAYSLGLARLGASVVVNDLANPHTVVEEIRASGGTAVPNQSSVENGEEVIKTAIDSFGRVDILINNAGILLDKSFQNMTDEMWDAVNDVHLRGTYKCAKAAYPYMRKQNYGRIINTTSTSGTYGNYGQANYATAKTAIVGFSKALAIEGRKNNIIVNCISPSAGTNLTKGVLPEEIVKSRKPDYVAPIVLLLSSDKVPADASGRIFEAGCGWQARTRFQRSDGYDFPRNTPLTPEMVLGKWSEIVSFTPGKTSNPEMISDSRDRILANIKISGDTPPSGRQWLDAIAKARSAPAQRSSMTFTDKEVLLYNLSLGGTPSQLPLVFEKHPDFHVLPSFGVIPGTTASRPFKLEDLVPNFNYKNMLHGEHMLEIRKYPIPTSGTFISECRLIDILDKGKASIAIIGTLTKDAATGDEIFYNELTLFLRGTGGFGGKTTRSEHSSTKSSSSPPSRKPDVIIEEKTSVGQAALYRLNGDRNPLHIDPAASSAGGYNKPILHGLCTFGIATKQIVLNYGPVKSIRMRFVGVVTPGETLRIESWKDGNDIIFQVKTKESGTLCTAGGCATLEQPLKTRL
ncbi:unnamed protein product [Clonostachys byssicola]|uniref:Ketoreductase domain-containing protein n=1 Tax=Clonostachys byssicola TaxID=160290 RepID=A0A9N9URY4_9HYPO|nr:unnamed protein product [Clonostachys byssicola]